MVRRNKGMAVMWTHRSWSRCGCSYTIEASRGSSRHDAPIHTLPKLTQRTGQGMLTGRSRYSDVTRATGWDSQASTGSTVLLKELLASNLELKKEFGSLKNEMVRMHKGITNIESPTNRSGRWSKCE